MMKRLVVTVVMAAATSSAVLLSTPTAYAGGACGDVYGESFTLDNHSTPEECKSGPQGHPDPTPHPTPHPTPVPQPVPHPTPVPQPVPVPQPAPVPPASMSTTQDAHTPKLSIGAHTECYGLVVVHNTGSGAGVIRVNGANHVVGAHKSVSIKVASHHGTWSATIVWQGKKTTRSGSCGCPTKVSRVHTAGSKAAAADAHVSAPSPTQDSGTPLWMYAAAAAVLIAAGIQIGRRRTPATQPAEDAETQDA